jgi:hypothetical protein
MSIKLQKTPDQEIKELLEKNLEMNKEIREMVKSIKTYIIWQRVWFVLKLVIIIIPITLGFIYLPPILSDIFEQYKGVLDFFQSIG